MLRAIVVDDEPHARLGLSRLLTIDGRVDVVDTCGSAKEAAVAVHRHAPDVIFLDIEMPGEDGFALLDEIEIDPFPAIVFVTAYESYALRAFDVAAVDYLLKPYSDLRLQSTIDRLVSLGDESPQALDEVLAALRHAAGARADAIARIPVRRRGRTHYVEVGDIDWMKADGDYVELHASDGAMHLVRGPLGGLLGRLDSLRFLRTHRSFAVRIERVAVLRPRGAGTAVLQLQDGTEVPVSARRRRRVARRLEGWGHTGSG